MNADARVVFSPGRCCESNDDWFLDIFFDYGVKPVVFDGERLTDSSEVREILSFKFVSELFE